MSYVLKAAMAAVLLALAGCAEPTGFAGNGDALRAPSFGRTLSRDYLQIVDVSNKVIEVDANGRTVRAPAPDGFCIPAEGVLSGQASVFFVMERCAGGDQGLLSVSIGKGPLFDEGGATPARLKELQAFLSTEAGRSNLGFDAGSGAIFLARATVEGGALFAIVKDGSGAGPGFAAPTLAKAFTEINGRMVVLTLLTQKAKPKGEEALHAELVGIVAGLMTANGGRGPTS